MGLLQLPRNNPNERNLKVDNLVGFTLDGHYNGTYMYEPTDVALTKCLHCGYRLDFFITNPNYTLKKTSKSLHIGKAVSGQADLSATYDGQTIVSRQFRDFCLQQGYKGMQFVDFPKDPEYFHLIVMPEVAFDPVRRGTRFEDFCSVCGNYGSVIGANPAYLQVVEPLKDGFYRSDILFGSADNKNPLIIVGIDTKSKLRIAKLKGLVFGPAYGSG